MRILLVAAILVASIARADEPLYVCKEPRTPRSAISAATVKLAFDNPKAIAQGARVVPAMTNGKPSGLKLYGIRPSSIFAMLGFVNGDTVLSINGFELTDVEKALQVSTKVQAAHSIELEVLRGGKPLLLSITIK